METTKFIYNGHEFDFDVADADNAKKFDDAIKSLEVGESKMTKGADPYTVIKENCELLKKFFEDCLGVGAGEKICTEKSNIRLCYDAYSEFLKFIEAQNQVVTQFKNKFASYSNRQQRRSKAKQ